MPDHDGREADPPSPASGRGDTPADTPIRPHRAYAESDQSIPRELVERARRGDQEAFAALFRLRGEAVTRYVSRILRSEAAEDAAAETFLRAWENLPRLRQIDRFDAWLFRIAHHVATDELRRRPTAPLLDAAEAPDPAHAANPEIVAAVHGETERMRNALLALPERQREVLVLRYFGDRSDAEVAVQLGTTEGNVRVLRSRATTRLRALLEEED